jgi:hypothetical protein
MIPIADDDLPLCGRTLCKDALLLASDLLKGVDQVELEKQLQLFATYNEQLAEVVSKALPADTTIDIQQTFELLKKYDSEEELFEALGIGYSSELAKVFSNVEVNDPALMKGLIAHQLTAMVRNLKLVEDSLLIGDQRLTTAEVLEKLDPQITELARLITQGKAYEPAIAQLREYIVRKKGALKGGQARREKYSELNGIVNEEARSLHSDKKAAHAAREIFKKFNETPSLLTGDGGQPMSVDPVHLFTKWIREDRNK